MNRIEQSNQVRETRNKLKEINRLFDGDIDSVDKEEILRLLGEVDEEVNNILGGRDNIDPIVVNTREWFEKYLSKILDKLNKLGNQKIQIEKIELDYDIFEQGEKDVFSEDIGDQNGDYDSELKIAPKVDTLKRVFDKIGYNTSEIKQYEEKINPKKKRKIPYQIFHLKQANNKKTILVCDEIGQATFVYDGIIDTQIFEKIKKGEEINNSIPLMIKYSENTFQQKLEIALGDKLIIDKNISKEKKEELTQEEAIKYFMDIGYDKLMKYSLEQIKAIECKGNKVTALSTKTGWLNESKERVKNPRGFQIFVNWLFGKKIEKKEEINKEEAIKYFKNIGYDNLLNYSSEQIGAIECKGNKVIALSTKTGWLNESKENIQIPRGFQVFVNWLFGKNVEKKVKIKKEEAIKYFKDIGYDNLMKYSSEQINAIECKGNKVKALTTKTGWLNESNQRVIYTSGFQLFINWLFRK